MCSIYKHIDSRLIYNIPSNSRGNLKTSLVWNIRCSENDEINIRKHRRWPDDKNTDIQNGEISHGMSLMAGWLTTGSRDASTSTKIDYDTILELFMVWLNNQCP